ncbi:MAG: DUF1553 domain-containing protein [Verrucomicrobiota bacterium]
MTSAGVRAEEVSFNRDVKPILSDRCFKCHGPDAKNQKSDYRLDTAEHAYADLGGYMGIVPGDLEASEFIARIHSTDPTEVMPTPESKMALTDEEKEILEKWILQGAKYEKHWSFQSIDEEIQVPNAGEGWAKNGIDRFVARKFEEEEVQPAEEVSRSKWLRRVSFDLTGLPPTLEELDAFETDQSPDAYERVVDRLLDSEAYAERMTAEWLDVARYSDSYGYQRDDERFVWPWRDWVLEAFRKNIPYSQFITEQLAGDLIPNATQDQQLATTFNRLHGHCMEGGSVLEEYRVEYVADRVETYGTAFLGLTMNCTKCHDHKYDPLTAKDFYSLSSFFANIDESGLIAYFTEAAPTPAMPLSTPEDEKLLEEKREAIDEMERKLVLAEEGVRERFEMWLVQGPAELESPERAIYLDFEEVTAVNAKDNRYENLAQPDWFATNKVLNVPAEGYEGKGVKLTGDDPLEVKAVGEFDRDQPWSASIWVKLSEMVPKANVMTRGKGADDSAGMGYEFLLLDGKPTVSLAHFWPGNAIRVQAKEAVKVGEWTHLGVSYDGSSEAAGLKIYVAGRSVPVEVMRDGLTRTINEFRRINYNDKKKDNRLGIALGQRFREPGLRNGLIDEFQFWTREISSLEMKAAFDGEAFGAALEKQGSGEGRDGLFEYYVKAVDEPVRMALDDLQRARAEWNAVMDGIPAISVMAEMDKPKKAYILERGAYDSHGEEVTADTPGFLPPMAEDMPKNRLGLAQWMLTSENPLTSRVAVNRYWQIIFGRGLVATSEDFGNQGTLPTHPDLLDWLSRDFMNEGWDLHALLKKMVLSATYRQSTQTTPEMRERDPENMLLARAHTTRLTAEMIRDNALAVSGLLVNKWGGPTVKPYQVEVAFNPEEADEGEGLYRRSVYTWWKRNSAAPVLTTFGVPKRDVCTVRREFTTSPLQSLILLNDPQFVEASRVTAVKLLERFGWDVPALVSEAYRKLTSRNPLPDEMLILEEMLNEQLAHFEAAPEEAEEVLLVGEAPQSEEFPKTQQAATTLMVNAMMNLDESLIER